MKIRKHGTGASSKSVSGQRSRGLSNPVSLLTGGRRAVPTFSRLEGHRSEDTGGSVFRVLVYSALILGFGFFLLDIAHMQLSEWLLFKVQP